MAIAIDYVFIIIINCCWIAKLAGRLHDSIEVDDDYFVAEGKPRTVTVKVNDTTTPATTEQPGMFTNASACFRAMAPVPSTRWSWPLAWGTG